MVRTAMSGRMYSLLCGVTLQNTAATRHLGNCHPMEMDELISAKSSTGQFTVVTSAIGMLCFNRWFVGEFVDDGSALK